MGIGIQPKVRLQTLSQVAPQNFKQVFKQRLTRPDKERENSQSGNLLLCGFKSKARDKALLLIDHNIYSHTNQNLRGNVEQLVNNGASSCRNNLATITPSVSDKAGQSTKTAKILVGLARHIENSGQGSGKPTRVARTFWKLKRIIHN